jgi:hypothetical protein
MFCTLKNKIMMILLNKYKREILEAKNALKNRSSMTKKEISFWSKQIKTNQEKQKFFEL